MAGSHGFAGGAHSHCVSAPDPAHPDFRGSLIAWSCQLYIDPFLKIDPAFPGCFADHFPDPFAVYFTHIREPVSKFLQVWSDQRIRYAHCDLVGDHHKISRMKVLIDTSCRIGEDQLFSS